MTDRHPPTPANPDDLILAHAFLAKLQPLVGVCLDDRFTHKLDAVCVTLRVAVTSRSGQEWTNIDDDYLSATIDQARRFVEAHADEIAHLTHRAERIADTTTVATAP